MHGLGTDLTIGERVAWYRHRRGLSQQVLANLVDRTEDWLNKVENNRIQLDRLSVITALARALDITLGDLLAAPSLVEWSVDTGRRTVPELRKDARFVTPSRHCRASLAIWIPLYDSTMGPTVCGANGC
jgi:transcriptional regulator with XRE-family HTH domain